MCVQRLHTRERQLIEKYAALAGSGRLFPYSAGYASRVLQKYLRLAGMYTFERQKSFHSLRHSTGDTLYRASRDIVAVATYLGHKSVESSRRYTHLSNDEINALAQKGIVTSIGSLRQSLG